MSQVLLKGGVAFINTELRAADVLIDGQRIAQIGTSLRRTGNSCAVVDCQGLFVLPGLIDMHIHVDDMIGQTPLADTWQTASLAAIQTGITTLVSFATQSDSRTISYVAKEMITKAEGKSCCDFNLHLTPTVWDNHTWQELENLKQRGFSTLKLYTTYRNNGLYLSYQDIRSVMEQAKSYGYTVLLHCEDEQILNQAHLAYKGDMSQPLSHALRRPPLAEIRAIEKCLAICKETGTPLHIVHVSTSEGAELIRRAAAECPVTFETCPQYLVLTEEQLKGQLGKQYLCSPPLRSNMEREQLIQKVREGEVDVLATDHCAIEKSDKESNAKTSIDSVPKGLPGVGSLVPLLREVLVHEPASDLPAVIEMLSTNPAKICGIYPRKGTLAVGSDADIAVVDLFAEPSTLRSSLADVYDPYNKMQSRYRAKRVYLRGTLLVEDGVVVQAQQPKGEFVCPT